MPQPPTTNAPRIWFSILSTAAGLLIALLVLWAIWNHESVLRWKESAGIVPFFLAMTILPALGVPQTPFLLAAGTTFGSRDAILGSLVAMGLNIAGSYWLARSYFRPWIAKFMRRRGFDRFHFDGRSSALRFALVVKLTPGLPAFMKNYFLGVTGIPFATYFIVSMLVSGVYGVALIVLGEAAFRHDIDRRTVIAVAVLAIPIVVWLWRRRREAPARRRRIATPNGHGGGPTFGSAAPRE